MVSKQTMYELTLTLEHINENCWTLFNCTIFTTQYTSTFNTYARQYLFLFFFFFLRSFFHRLICTGYMHIYIHRTRKPEQRRREKHTELCCISYILHRSRDLSAIMKWYTADVLCVCKSLVMCVSRSSQCQHIECRRNKIAMCLHFQWKLNDKTSTWMSIFGQ